jgi:hypothetical protein
MSKDRMINSEKRPLPSKPAASLVTVEGLKLMKGGSDISKEIPKENQVKDGCCKSK